MDHAMKPFWLRPTRWAPWIATVLGIVLAASAAAEAPRVAVFGFELIDTSLEGEMSGARADEQQRLVMISDRLRRELTRSGRYTVVEVSPARDRIERAGLLHGCNGCEADIAKDLGADLAMSGTVQKVSNLILNINLYLRDAKTSELLRVMSVDIRGNTDESWSRGVSYIVRRRFLKD
jgi:hypothetical protein